MNKRLIAVILNKEIENTIENYGNLRNSLIQNVLSILVIFVIYTNSFDEYNHFTHFNKNKAGKLY